ncbi:MAG: NADH:ubiquinone reductase (Na(+)-transporting) subunit B [Proteobacteria bacterium]|nr:NADH:ubiquinone reductase (Na(+)-transporting) subunit B [Pseudomonadota bacterium]
MRALRRTLDRIAPLFEKGGRLEKYAALYELPDTFLYTPGSVTRTSSHVRDAIDQKRFMGIVALALIPCVILGVWNIGHQAQLAIAQGALPLDDWRTWVYAELLGLSFDPGSVFGCAVQGLLYYLPVLLVTFLVGGNIEAVSAVVRGHEVNEGFVVTGMLFPLVLPPAIPLWMVAMGIAFGIIFGKEIFGGTGMNFLNPALTARVFLFFAYPAQMSGEAPWIAADFAGVDSFSGATWLARAAVDPAALEGASWTAAFLGTVPGSMGETSTLACLLGMFVLLLTRVGSWRTMGGVTLGTLGMSLLLNAAGSQTNPMFGVPFHWHVVLGGWAFGMVFMATDPVSSAFTDKGKWIYGAAIGVLCVLIRVVNPAYPEGMMLSILFMNMFAPVIDYYIVRANIRRRLDRSAA